MLLVSMKENEQYSYSKTESGLIVAEQKLLVKEPEFVVPQFDVITESEFVVPCTEIVGDFTLEYERF